MSGGRTMGGIQQCVKDVLSIADKTEDFGQAKTRIEQLFVVSKAQNRRHLAVAQRVRDHINRAYNDVPLGARPCLDEVIEWLDRDYLRQRRQRSSLISHGGGKRRSCITPLVEEAQPDYPIDAV
jgi:hypothetical protein